MKIWVIDSFLLKFSSIVYIAIHL